MNSTIELLANKGQGTIRLDLEYQPGIALLTIDNPKRHNALSGKMMVEFYHAITQLERNVSNDLVALIAIGGGAPKSSFCAGLDLTFAREFIKSPEESLAINELMHDAIDRLTKLPFITVAVVTGGAIGGGSELVTGFDFICMSRQSGFVHFVQTRMGLSSPWGGLRRLVGLVGRKRALIWMAGGSVVRAEDGSKEGLVDVVVERDEDCLNAAVSFLQPFLFDERTQAKVSSHAVRGMKKLLIRQDKENDWEYEKRVFSSTAFSKF
ncbi:MAG: ClpP/crotonase-like domain-containing protein [Benjaminiella poitrasii]|nr:MAG: ClpP/crotonase-like domain-containing protein [Benjaminiella poitrasii]